MRRREPKRPKRSIEPVTKKLPQIDPHNSPENITQNKPVWRIGSMDFEGPWGWSRIRTPDLLRAIHTKLRSFETMTWSEIEGRDNHHIPVHKISKEAKARLREINLDDYDMLFSFRLSGKERLWGIRKGEILHIIWWDPEHSVYPISKRHT